MVYFGLGAMGVGCAATTDDGPPSPVEVSPTTDLAPQGELDCSLLALAGTPPLSILRERSTTITLIGAALAKAVGVAVRAGGGTGAIISKIIPNGTGPLGPLGTSGSTPTFDVAGLAEGTQYSLSLLFNTDCGTVEDTAFEVIGWTTEDINHDCPGGKVPGFSCCGGVPINQIGYTMNIFKCMAPPESCPGSKFVMEACGSGRAQCDIGYCADQPNPCQPWTCL